MHISTSPVMKVVAWPLLRLCEQMGERSPKRLIQIRYLFRFHKLPDLVNPKDLNEKILWQKLYADTTKWSELADKYLVRNYITNKGLDNILVKLYGHWDNVNEIDFNALPDELIFKANNGDGKGSFRLIHNLKNENHKALKNLFQKWLTQKHIGDLSAEPHYKNIKPQIIAEQLLTQEPGKSSSVTDFKIWCINGEPQYIMVINDRDKSGGHATIMLYDTEWNPHEELCVFTSSYPKGKPQSKPQNLDEMLRIARVLSEEFPILRVDLYNIDGKIYFGELTFTSLSGMMNYFTPKLLLELGQKADLSRVQRRKDHLETS